MANQQVTVVVRLKAKAGKEAQAGVVQPSYPYPDARRTGLPQFRYA
jgi:hypothetical protein